MKFSMQLYVIFVISFPYLFGCASTNQLDSFSATNLCNDPILNLSNKSSTERDIITSKIILSSAVTVINPPNSTLLQIPVLSQTDAFWEVRPGERIIIDLKSSTGSQYWITGVGISQLPPNTLGECYTQEDINDTEVFEFKNRIDGSSSLLTSAYAASGQYRFTTIARGRDVSVKVSVSPVLSDAIEISKIYNTSNNTYCLRIELFGCLKQVHRDIIIYPTILSYSTPIPTTNSLYTGICSQLSCTGGNGILNNGTYGSSSPEKQVEFSNSSATQITFFFSTNVTLRRIAIHGIYPPSLPMYLYQFPPINVELSDLASNISNFSFSGVSYTLSLLASNHSIAELTLLITSLQPSTIMLNEIQLFSNTGILLNCQNQSISVDTSPTAASTLPATSSGIPTLSSASTTTMTQMPTTGPPPTTNTPPPPTNNPPPPTNNPPPTTDNRPPPTNNTPPTTDNRPPPPPNPPPTNPNTPPPDNQNNPEPTDPRPPPTPAPSLLEEIFNFTSPASLISIVICVICLLTTCISAILASTCWYFLIKYKLRYKETKKENEKLRISNEVYGASLRRIDYPSNDPKPLNHQNCNFLLPSVYPPQPPLRSVYTDERIYEAIPTMRPPTPASSVYEIEDINDIYGDSMEKWDPSSKNSGVSSAEVHFNPSAHHEDNPNPNFQTKDSIPQVWENEKLLLGREEAYIPMASTHF